MSHIFLRIWTFRCAQCKRAKDAPFGATMDTWSPALKRGGKFFCSLACARAYDQACANRKKKSASIWGEPYTEADEAVMIRMRDEGRSWPEIGEAIGRSPKAAASHYNHYVLPARAIGQSAG